MIIYFLKTSKGKKKRKEKSHFAPDCLKMDFEYGLVRAWEEQASALQKWTGHVSETDGADWS